MIEAKYIGNPEYDRDLNWYNHCDFLNASILEQEKCTGAKSVYNEIIQIAEEVDNSVMVRTRGVEDSQCKVFTLGDFLYMVRNNEIDPNLPKLVYRVSWEHISFDPDGVVLTV